MVRVLIGWLFIVLLLNACCYTGSRTSFGLPRKKNVILDGSANSYALLDTSVLYKGSASFFYNTSLRRHTNYEKDDHHYYPYVSYLKFYSGGKVGLFIIAKKDTVSLNGEYFNPERAKMGYYQADKEGGLKVWILTIGDCNLFVSKEKGFVTRDSLVLERNFGRIYKKKKVPKEWLENWKPDW